MLDERYEYEADGSQVSTITTYLEEGRQREVVTRLTPENAVLERTTTLFEADGSKVVVFEKDTLQFNPSSGTVLTQEVHYDASGEILSDMTETVFANGQKVQITLRVEDGGTSRETAEYTPEGRLLLGQKFTTLGDGRQRIALWKTHIDGSTERIEASLDANGNRTYYLHVYTDVLGREFYFQDAHTPTERPTTAAVTLHPTVHTDKKGFGEDGWWYDGVANRDFTRTEIRYSNGDIIYEYLGAYNDGKPAYRHLSAQNFDHLQTWGGARPPYRVETIEETFRFQTIRVLAEPEGPYEFIIVDDRYRFDEQRIIARDRDTKEVLYVGTVVNLGNSTWSYAFESADGLTTYSGVKVYTDDWQGALYNPHLATGALRATETTVDPDSGTKRMIDTIKGSDNSVTHVEVHYRLDDDGQYVRTSAVSRKTYSDGGVRTVETLYDAHGEVTEEKHRYQSGDHVALTTITHLGNGAKNSVKTLSVNGKILRTEATETRQDGGEEIVTTQVHDANGNRIEYTSTRSNGVLQIKTIYDPKTEKVLSTSTAEISFISKPDGSSEQIFKDQKTGEVLTLRWGPTGEYAGGSKVVTSTDGKYVTTEVFTPEGHRTITVIERKDGKITSINTSNFDPFGNLIKVSRSENLAIADPASAIAAKEVMQKIGFHFVKNPDGTERIDFTKRVAGAPFTIEDLDLSTLNIDLSKNPLESMTEAFLEIVKGNATPENYSKLMGTLLLTLKDAKSSPQAVAAYMAFCGIDMALAQTPYGAQWLSFKKDLNKYLNIGLQGGMFGGYDVVFTLIDDLAGGELSRWMQENGLGNVMEAFMHPSIMNGTPGQMVTDAARILMTGGAYGPLKFVYTMLPDDWQETIDNALKHILGYTQVTQSLNVAAGYIDDGVKRGIRYTQEAFETLFQMDTYVAVADSFSAMSTMFASATVSRGNTVYDAFSTAYGAIKDVTKDLGNVMRDIASRGISAAADVITSSLGSLENAFNAVSNGAVYVGEQIYSGIKKLKFW